MKEAIMPIDLGQLLDKVLAIQHALKFYDESSLSEEMKQFHLKQAKTITGVVVRDIEYLLDEKLFDGKRSRGVESLLNK